MGANLLPFVPGTVGLWQLQGNMLDTSGNGINLSIERGVETYAALPTSGGLQAFSFNGATNLLGPLAPVLAVAGEFTAQLWAYTTGAGVYTYFANEGTISGNYSLYSMYNSAGGLGNFGTSYTDQTHNAALGTPNPPGVVIPLNELHLLSLVRTSTGGSNYVSRLWVDANLQSGGVNTTAQTADGTERLRVGGFTGGANYTGYIASLRFVGHARTAAEIAADANRAIGNLSYRGLNVRLRSH